MVSLVKIIYVFNGEESSLSFDPTNKLKLFKNIVNLTQKLHSDQYDIIYGKNLITSLDEVELKRIIYDDKNPVFYIELISIDSKAKGKKIYHKNKLEISKTKSFKYKVSIQNFPSRTEMYSLINSFLDSNFIKDSYQIENKQSGGVEVSFGLKVTYFFNKDYALNLIKFIDKEKSFNLLYSKTVTMMLENNIILTANSSLGKFKDEFKEGITFPSVKDDPKKNQNKNEISHVIKSVYFILIVVVRYFSIVESQFKS